ncbi:circularly permuted type 2 ATP-grasp protein [Jiella sp. CQZ9-1]|uniref:Circularly permuted type 2 ATP-grasp protein n=2 Tax=Jiella flava TaxID=2816857 RepID=A0A939FTU3_9HYPH|nr:circularly permuted type 2 ATP-grasp protein [Jiella flava]
MMAPDGAVRPHYARLMAALSAMAPPEFDRRSASARQYLSEAGVFHQVYGEASEQSHDWPLGHPALIIDRAEWTTLCDGLVQRAGFLERLLADLYGTRRIITEGILPGVLLGQNPEFFRPLAYQGQLSTPLLSFIAIDLARGPDGRWWVLGDRTQAPSGAGFALENRVATSKAFPDLSRALNVERLAGFFRKFREMLFALGGPDRARIGLLTPGPHNETYYEHAYLARYLGLLLLEGGDLVVHGDRAEVRTVDGFQPIGVLWRRLDADFCDPLELFGASRIGTPGLVRAVRSGALTLVNALGAGILETPAFLAFQTALAQALIGEELKLPTIATWWCGDAESRGFVAESRDRLQLGPAFPGRVGEPVRPGGPRQDGDGPIGSLSPQQGARLIGREIAALSTTPVYGSAGLEPRPVTLRTFLMRDEDGWHVMPGGFARVADSADARAISMQQGGGSIDVWIPSDSPAKPVSLLGPRSDRFARRLPGALPARAADNLFWLGRYAERCESATRLLRLYAARNSEGWSEGELEARVAAILADYGVDVRAPQRGLSTLARQAANTASRIRERFSPDAWRTLKAVVDLIPPRAAPASEGEPDVVALTAAILTHLAGFAGLAHENMYQFTGWRFMQCGRALERGQATASCVSALLSGEAPGGALEALLTFADSSVTYRRRYSVDLSRETVIDLTVLDPLNPRSLAFQVNSLTEVISALPGVHLGETPDLLLRRLARLKVRLQTADAGEVDTAFVGRVASDLGLISDLVTRRYLLSSPQADTPDWIGGSV